MKRCNRCRGSHLQCADCLIEDGPTLLARAEKAEAEVVRLRAAIHADLIADTHYCEHHEMMFQSGYGAPPSCPHCECERLEAALVKVAELSTYDNEERDEPDEDEMIDALCEIHDVARRRTTAARKASDV